MPAAAPVEQQIEGEDEVLGGRRAEAMRQGQPATDRHPGAAQPHRQAQPVAAPRQRDPLQGERGERGLGGQGPAAPALAARLHRCYPPGEGSFAGPEEPGRDHGIGVQHHHRVPLERARVLESGLAGGGPARLIIGARASSTDAPNRRATVAVASVHRSATTSTMSPGRASA